MIAARTIAEIDWRRWQPDDRATVLFVVRDGQILLIRKKRGLGAGKINGPGGRLEPGETSQAAAIREVEEELRVTPTGVRQCGRLRFQFVDGYALEVDVFRADDCEGEAQETEEARPRWTQLSAIPYEEMWADDVLWLPRLLAEEWFAGRFVFDGDALLDHVFDA
ncbi:MAG: 8-oxo-dGTP diphosphatase [Myxococcales bacterium]|nr:8-oxo-dGTP diphosphatase [Myxococcales bacterium]